MELLSAVAITGILLAPTTASSSEVEALVRRIERHHHSARDLTARFVQTYRSAVLNSQVTERGTVAIKRPGRMRWEYREPEKKLFISDGHTFYFYVPADKQVIVRDQAGERTVPTLLLSGRGDILTEFEATLDAPSRLRLTPRRPDPEIDRIFVEVDSSDRIRAIEVFDAQGNRSRFEFDALRENVGLPDRLFRFEIPRGVDVVTG